MIIIIVIQAHMYDFLSVNSSLCAAQTCDSLLQLMQLKEIAHEGFAVTRVGYQRQMTYSVINDYTTRNSSLLFGQKSVLSITVVHLNSEGRA